MTIKEPDQRQQARSPDFTMFDFPVDNSDVLEKKALLVEMLRLQNASAVKHVVSSETYSKINNQISMRSGGGAAAGGRRRISQSLSSASLAPHQHYQPNNHHKQHSTAFSAQLNNREVSINSSSNQSASAGGPPPPKKSQFGFFHALSRKLSSLFTTTERNSAASLKQNEEAARIRTQTRTRIHTERELCDAKLKREFEQIFEAHSQTMLEFNDVCSQLSGYAGGATARGAGGGDGGGNFSRPVSSVYSVDVSFEVPEWTEDDRGQLHHRINKINEQVFPANLPFADNERGGAALDDDMDSEDYREIGEWRTFHRCRGGARPDLEERGIR